MRCFFFQKKKFSKDLNIKTSIYILDVNNNDGRYLFSFKKRGGKK